MARENWNKLVAARSAWVQRVEAGLVTLREGLKLENAEGETLRRWGVSLGFPAYPLGPDQPLADEDWHRELLVIRRLVLRSDQRPNTLISISNDYDALFGATGVELFEHQFATTIIRFRDMPLSALECGHRLLNGMQSPGVRLILESVPSAGYFGFDEDGDALGFDEAFGDGDGGVWAERVG